MADEADWSDVAEAQLEAYLDYLALADPVLALKATREIREIADQTARRPGLARKSRWDGLFERSVRRWHRILVFRVDDASVRVLAVYDMRQDFSSLDPRPR